MKIIGINFLNWMEANDNTAFKLAMRTTRPVYIDVKEYPEVRLAYIKWRLLGEPDATPS